MKYKCCYCEKELDEDELEWNTTEDDNYDETLYCYCKKCGDKRGEE